MEDQLKNYLDEFVSMLKDGGDIALQELPKFINEYLTYYTAYHGVLWLLGLVAIFGAVYVYIRVNRSLDWDEEAAGFMLIPTAVVIVPCTVMFFENLFSFIKITVAPRLYLVENLMELVS